MVMVIRASIDASFWKRTSCTSRFVVKGAGRTGQDSDGHFVNGSWLWLVYIRLERCSQLSLEVRFRRCWCYLRWARCSIKDNAGELSAIK
jgi:hypothetical protein